MNKVDKWRDAKIDMEEVVEWLGNAKKVDSQSHTPYSLIVRTGNSTFQYCGQAYAGATNYHKTPSSFCDAMDRVLLLNAEKLFNEALDLIESEVNRLGREAKEEVEAMLKEIGGL